MQQTFSEADRDEMRALGRPGWEKLLRDTPAEESGPFPDPYGRGTSYYEFAGTGIYGGLYIRHTPPAPFDPVTAPDSFMYYNPPLRGFAPRNTVNLSYVLDPNAPQPKAQQVA
ncbi:hypothetical protein ACIPYR_35060 [Streptomyces parvus]|uniref:hypothetical protein n=1 Tax=Streptomyces parvus TaxID=66428 RepID=UPI00380C4111